jgi:hypothetical protein
LNELDLDPERGLAESIHVVLFDDDVIGSDGSSSMHGARTFKGMEIVPRA